MKRSPRSLRVSLSVVLLHGLCSVAAASDVSGSVTPHEAPRGSEEVCVAITPVPGGTYSAADRTEEAALCRIDFYSNDFALCPKTFSTSPGTLVYGLTGGPYSGRADAFEAEHCQEMRIVRSGVTRGPVSFKMTMNAPDTSATFAPAALLYYHFSRYFGTRVGVPVSVYRSMDREEHFSRVVRTGVAVSSGSRSSPMNRAGWKRLADGAQDPASYRPTRELYTAGGRQIFGVLLETEGRRYGAEINGTRKSGWGAGQNRDFQQTAPYLALRHDAALPVAIRHGINKAKQDPDLRKAMGNDPTDAQMVFWMTELTEIVLLDYIFSQQDRVGNIDYVDYWYWIEGGQPRRQRVTGDKPPAEIADRELQRIRRSAINDNDAGGRIPYANYAKTTGMLENLHHFPPDTYARLQQMAADFQASGSLYRWLQDSFGISQRQAAQVINNTIQASRILGDACRAGTLRFSLDPDAFLVNGAAEDRNVRCGP